MRVFFIARSKYFGVHTIFASLSAFRSYGWDEIREGSS